jgi:quercetin dioxygenase-like cupin family protein
MRQARYTSRDFAAVPAALAAEDAERLLHSDVIDAADGRENAFSAERQHSVWVVDLPTRTLSMTIGGLNPGQSTRMHRHNYETVIYVLSGAGRSVIGGREVSWKAGDAFYVPAWAWHQHVNDRDVSAFYLACENAPLLQNLGVAIREER